MEHFLRESWRKGQPAFGLWNTIGNTLVAEVIAATKPDYVCVDMQHGGTHDGILVGMLQAVVVGGSAPLVRVPECNPALIMKALDAGARGVVVPLVESGEQAAASGRSVSISTAWEPLVRTIPSIGSRWHLGPT